MTSLEGQLSSAWTSDLFMRVLSSQGRKQVTCVFRAGPPWTNSHTVAATILVWTAVILNSSETSGPLSNGSSLEVYIKIFWSWKGGFARTPSNPPCLRAWARSLCYWGNNRFVWWKTSSACQHTTYLPHLGPDVIWLHKSWLDEDKFELSSKTKSELSDPVCFRTYLFHHCTSKFSQQYYIHNHDSAIKIVVISIQIRNVTSHIIGYNIAALCAPQHEVECLAVIKEQWLSDIHTCQSPTEPFMVFTNFVEIRYIPQNFL